MSDIVPNNDVPDVPVIGLSYPGQTLESFLWLHHHVPDEAIVQLTFLSYTQKPDGTYGPLGIPLGRLREEYLIRTAFPHEAATFVR